MKLCSIILLTLIASGCQTSHQVEQESFEQVLENAIAASEGLERCHHYLRGWLAHTDPESGLLPRKLPAREGYRKTGGAGEDFWNTKDCAADNYPFLVLSSFFTDRDLFETRMKEILEAEVQLTTRKWDLPDTYSFSSKDYLYDQPDLERMIFGASEYVKDGLLPVTEWLGPSPWSERMLGLVGAVWNQATIQTPAGLLPSLNTEVNGEMLQVLSRIYWMTGETKYLEWAERLGDYYLLFRHPARQDAAFRLRDHGCEILSGLCELYAAVSFARPEKKESYQEPLFEMLDRVLEVGRNEDGLFYNSVNLTTGEVLNEGVSDSWGYNLNGFYTIYLVDDVERYREAAITALSSLENYRDFDWENGSADGFADSIEGALNLYNREQEHAKVARWIDEEIRHMWSRQQPDGVIEGWHGDGNFARTTLMYVLWKTSGTWLSPWNRDLTLGALETNEGLLIAIRSEEDWQGRLFFDRPRHQDSLRLPIDWPRINQFPEWYKVTSEAEYLITDLRSGDSFRESGSRLIEGLERSLKAGQQEVLLVAKE